MAWLAAINLVTFVAFVFDKLASQVGTARVSEMTLLTAAAAGGSVGALLGMLIARHKTAKATFRLRLLGILVLQASVVAAYAWVVR
jgi:uncharacterized membrane protein YsdA (DUF1294 family)